MKLSEYVTPPTQEYDQQIIDFLAEKVVSAPGKGVGSAVLYGVYGRWADGSDRYAMSGKRFGTMLKELLGPNSWTRVAGGTRFLNIALKTG